MSPYITGEALINDADVWEEALDWGLRIGSCQGGRQPNALPSIQLAPHTCCLNPSLASVLFLSPVVPMSAAIPDRPFSSPGALTANVASFSGLVKDSHFHVSQSKGSPAICLVL